MDGKGKGRGKSEKVWEKLRERGRYSWKAPIALILCSLRRLCQLCNKETPVRVPGLVQEPQEIFKGTSKTPNPPPP